MNDKVLTGGVVLALVISGLAYFAQPEEVVKETIREQVVRELGAAAGPEHTEHQKFFANFSRGGAANTLYATTSTATAYTLTRTEVDFNDSYISWLPNVSTTLTTMASSSAPLSGLREGESIEQLWYNASTTAGATITFAAGTGVDLQEDEGGTVVVNGLETARLTWLKKDDTDVVLIVEPYQVGD